MKFFLQLLMVIVLGFMLELFLPWWSIAISAGLAGALMGGNGMRSFFAGFLGMFLLWWGSALMLIGETHSGLADLVGQLLPGKPFGLGVAMIAGFVGAIVGGFAAATGDALRGMIAPKKAA